jgi:predicted deacylase
MSQEVEPGSLRGRLVLVPAPLSADENVRTLLDQMVREYVLPRVDVVVDLGGLGDDSMRYARCAAFPQVDDRGHWEEMAQVAAVFDAAMIVVSDPSKGSLIEAALGRGKTVVGGAFENLDLVSVNAALEGAKNVLKYYGMVDGDLVRIEPARPSKPRVVAPAETLTAPIDGLFEPAAALGGPIEAGQEIGRLWSLDPSNEPPVEIRSPRGGWLLAGPTSDEIRSGQPIARITRPYVKR